MNFRKSFCTNTRLMGTMMLMIEWVLEARIVSHVFMLDAEGLGISDFYILLDESEESREAFYKQKYGGLGGINVLMTEEEACFLVKDFMEKNERYEKPLPENFNIDIQNFYKEKAKELDLAVKVEDLEFALVDNMEKKYSAFRKNIFKKICKNIETENEFVNYMIMRLVARDREALFYFSGNEEVSKLHLTKINGALLYNEIEKKSQDRFVCNCVYEDTDGYYEAKIIVSIDRKKVKEERALKFECDHYDYGLRSFMIASVNAVYDFEVFDIISKEEALDIYKISDGYDMKELENLIYNAYPAIQGIEFENGSLYIQYYPDNAHVDGEVFVINNDIMFLIYVNEASLFLATYTQEARKLIEESLNYQLKERIKKVDRMIFQQNVLFDFIESGNDDFYDFLD